MRLLHVISSMDPRGGGPANGVNMIAREVSGRGHSVEILTLDAPDAAFLSASPVPIHAIGPSLLGYRYNAKAVSWLKERGSAFDAVIVNGLWQYNGLAVHRAFAGTRLPYFVFAHGMLDPWFKQAYPLKHVKKWLYWPWGQYRILRDAAAVIFTSEEERRLARKAFWLYRCNEAVTTYGASEPPADFDGALAATFRSRFPETGGKRILLFLSRIQMKKGCDLLIEAFAKVASDHPDLHLVMAGPDQEGWVAALKERAIALGIEAKITWTGMLQGEEKWGAFYAAEAFCLPSHQENFGIAVAESLACSTPVLISDKVNIWREVESDGAGIVGPDTLKGTVDVLQSWLRLSATAKELMIVSARASFDSRFQIDRVVDSLLEIVGAGSAPSAKSESQG